MANPTPPSPTIAGTTTLSAIKTKARRLSNSISTVELSDADLNNYINTYVVYDFPEQLRTFNLRTTFTFFTNPGQDVYPTDQASFGTNPAATNNVLYNFQNKYLTIHPPVYCAGYQILFTQSQEHFWGIYPMINSIASIGPTGDGATSNFTGVINTQQQVIPPGLIQNYALVQNNVLFDSVGNAGQGLALADVPVIDGTTGNPTLFGNLYDPNSAAYAAALKNPPVYNGVTIPFPTNQINYLTGQFDITFTSPPAQGVTINSQTIPVQRSIPQAMLFFHNEFIIRPVPDQAYRINFEVYQRPTALLDEGQSPELEEYWQLIAYGAARKILQDRGQHDLLVLLEPEYKMQEALVLRRTIKQLTNQRTATIYAETMDNGIGYSGWGGGNYPL